jgi:hypothetical protein
MQKFLQTKHSRRLLIDRVERVWKKGEEARHQNTGSVPNAIIFFFGFSTSHAIAAIILHL